ncbi:unnamed protein product, partial [Notodromas monacha]
MKNIDSKWANFIDGLWEYRGNTSIVLIEHILRKNMAIGVIHEPSQQLVGWFLMQETGCQGILHVTEEHRGKGIAQVLVREMQETLLGLNLEPVSVILDTNEPSYRLFRKSGYDAEHSTSHAMRRASLESGKHGGLLLVQGTRNDSISGDTLRTKKCINNKVTKTAIIDGILRDLIAALVFTETQANFEKLVTICGYNRSSSVIIIHSDL